MRATMCFDRAGHDHTDSKEVSLKANHGTKITSNDSWLISVCFVDYLFLNVILNITGTSADYLLVKTDTLNHSHSALDTVNHLHSLPISALCVLQSTYTYMRDREIKNVSKHQSGFRPNRNLGDLTISLSNFRLQQVAATTTAARKQFKLAWEAKHTFQMVIWTDIIYLHLSCPRRRRQLTTRPVCPHRLRWWVSSLDDLLWLVPLRYPLPVTETLIVAATSSTNNEADWPLF